MGIAELKRLLSRGQLDTVITEASKCYQLLNSSPVTTEQASGVQPQDIGIHTNELPELIYLLAVANRLAKQGSQATAYLQRLLELEPDHARAHQELGLLYKSQLIGPQDGVSAWQMAAQHFYRAVVLNPALLSSWKPLAEIYTQHGNDQGASIAQTKIEQLNRLPKPVLGARDLLYSRDLITADKVIRQFLQQHPTDTQAIFTLAQIRIAMKLYAEAVFLLESVLELTPDDQEAATELLQLSSKIGRFKQSLDLVEQCLAKRPDVPPLLVAKATALVGIGNMNEAIKLYQRVLQDEPENAHIHLLLGHALKAQGKLADAIACYQSAYKRKPRFGDAFWSLANTKTYRFGDEELRLMEAHLRDQMTSTEDKIHLAFALGKAHEFRKDYDRAFDYWQIGNELKKAQVNYQPEVLHRQVEHNVQYITTEVVQQHGGAGCHAPDPIFIVGLPRSGSTLIEQILASHSMVDGTMELHNVLNMAAKLRMPPERYPSNIYNMEPEQLRQLGEEYIAETQIYRQGAPRFIDKMPNNFIHVGLIKLILPNAKIIDARRHPMACGLSCYQQLFAEGQDFSYDFDHFAHYYRDYLTMMAHWDVVFPGQIHRVYNEQLVQDFEQQVKDLLDYCDLPFESNCLKFHQTERTIKTPSSEQVRQPINDQGVNRWKLYELKLLPLRRRLSDLSILIN